MQRGKSLPIDFAMGVDSHDHIEPVATALSRYEQLARVDLSLLFRRNRRTVRK